MEYEKIKQLMEDMGNSKLTAIDIDFPDGTKIHMKKEEKQVLVTRKKCIYRPRGKSGKKGRNKRRKREGKYCDISNGRNFLWKTFS